MIPGGRLQTLPTRVGSHWLSPQNQRYSINLGGLQADLKGGSGGAEPSQMGRHQGLGESYRIRSIANPNRINIYSCVCLYVRFPMCIHIYIYIYDPGL